jgi:hypothetical protein
MESKLTLGAALVAVIIALSAFLSPAQVPFGASSGPVHTETQYFDGGLTFGSGCFATSTTGTLTSRTLRDNGCIRIAPTGAGQGVVSLTLPATSTMSDLLPKVGSCRVWFVDAGSVAAATTTTIVAGAGHNVVGLDATGAGTGADVIDGNEFGTIKMCRQSTGDVITFVQEYIHAD